MPEGQPAPEGAEETTPVADAATLDPDHRAALELMEEICASTGQEVRPVVHALQPPYMYVELVGEDVRMTWGRMGHSLDALQLLANMILARRVETDIRMILDADGYRERRAEALRERAREIAKEVKLRNEEAELEPLPPHERRIIHTALADDPDIRTYSEGDEPGRRVVISPRR